MKILVTGATGLVGTALVRALAGDGHTVCGLRRPGGEKRAAAEGFDVAWNPATGELGGAAVGADAVVNLAGASIADRRWSMERKALLRSSRVDTTRALVNALGKMNVKPAVLVSASAIGYYGNRGEELLTEESAAGTGAAADDDAVLCFCRRAGGVRETMDVVCVARGCGGNFAAGAG